MKNELINGRTPEEIKRGLSCSGSRGNVKCSECAYCMGQFGDEDCNYECDQIDNDALALIEHLEAQQPKWINVKERLPEPFVSVQVHMPGERPHPTVREGYISNEGVWVAGYFRRESDEVTHWANMSEPPKEGE